MEAELYIDAKATLGEGPCWDAQKKLLYWVDIIEKKIHIHHYVTKTNESITLDSLVGAVVARESGGFIAATQAGFVAIDEQTKEQQLIVDPESGAPSNRFNDGKCDPAGRFWAGTMHIDEDQDTGALYVMDHDLSVRKQLTGITISNGLAWSPNHKTMYYIDSPTKQIAAFDYDLASGNITNKRIAITIPDGEGIPDGMTIDTDGNLWIAQWGGYKVSKWNPTTGEKLGEVSVPAKQVTSCAFGGESNNELFITTARRNLNQKELNNHPHSGGIFRVKTDTKGLEMNVFKG